MVLVEKQYKEIRQKLDELGYHLPCSVESVLLVEKLLNDLHSTRNKYIMYENMSASTLEDCEKLKNYIDTYKNENKRLGKENNQMHLDNIRVKEEFEKTFKEQKSRINELENMYSDLEFNYMEQIAEMSSLRQILLEKKIKLHELEGKTMDASTKLKECGNNLREMNIRDGEDILSVKDQRNEVEAYKSKVSKLLDDIETLEKQIQTRDNEIIRLSNQLENQNVPCICCLKKNCACHELNFCHQQNFKPSNEFEVQLKEAKIKQHQAMEKANNLAERIQELEEELIEFKVKDVSSEKCSCGTTISLLQGQHDETQKQMKEMEVRIVSLQNCISSLQDEKDKSYQIVGRLEEEKTNLLKKFENIQLIEKDLTLEINRLHQINANLKSEISQLVEKNNKIENLFKEAKKDVKNKSVLAKEHLSDCEQCEHFKGERDYYSNELHRLKEKVYSAERIHDMRCCSHIDSHKSVDMTLMKKLQSEIDYARSENMRLKEEIEALKNRMSEFSNFKYDSNKLLENQIMKLEHDRGFLTSSNSNLKNKLFSTEQNYIQLKRTMEKLTEELDNYKAKNNHLKKLNIQLEMSLNNSECTKKQIECDFTNCRAKVKALEKELKRTTDEINAIKKEKQDIRENLLRLDNEKDELLLKLDEKAIYISKLDRDLQNKIAQLSQVESKKCKLQSQLQSFERILHDSEEKCRGYAQDLKKMQIEIESLQTCKENLLLENKNIKRELAAVGQDNILTNHALEKYRKEAEDLKRELQTYVDEVRRVEEMLLEKEQERERLLEQFNVLSIEASHLESNNQSLECEANLTKDSLKETQEKLFTLQKNASVKDSLVSSMEHQVRQLSDQIVQLQTKISEMSNRELMLTSDLEAARNLCCTLEEQKQHCNNQFQQISSNEQMLREQLDRLECENVTLHDQLCHEQRSTCALENVLTSTRYDAMEKSIYNEDLTEEVKKMKEKVTALENKLIAVTTALSECQNACADYHYQNVHLKRQLTNEKFEKAKELDSTSTSL